MTKKIILTKLRCNRCGHGWIPRRVILPGVCPKCHSPYWNRRIKPAQSEQEEAEIKD